MIITIYFILFLYLLYKYRKIRGSVAYFLLLLYATSALLSFAEFWVGPITDYPINNQAIIYYILCIVISIYPFLVLGRHDSEDFNIPHKFIYYLSLFLIFWGFIELFYAIGDLYKYRAILLSDMSEIRSLYYQGDRISNSGGNIIRILAKWVHFIQFMSPFCCFYYYKLGKKKFALLLFIASLSFPVENMTIGEREATLVFLANYGFCYFFFGKSLTQKAKKTLKKVTLIGLSPFALFISLMTFFRFNARVGGVELSIFNYGGDQPYLFSFFFTRLNIENQMLGGRLNFGYLFPAKEQLAGQINDYIYSYEYLNRFAGMPGSFFLDFGYMAIFVISFFTLFYLLIIKKSQKKQGRYSFVMLFLLYFSFQILFMNIFYFDFKSRYGVIMSSILFLTILLYESVIAKKRK